MVELLILRGLGAEPSSEGPAVFAFTPFGRVAVKKPARAGTDDGTTWGAAGVGGERFSCSALLAARDKRSGVRPFVGTTHQTHVRAFLHHLSTSVHTGAGMRDGGGWVWVRAGVCSVQGT